MAKLSSCRALRCLMTADEYKQERSQAIRTGWKIVRELMEPVPEFTEADRRVISIDARMDLLPEALLEERVTSFWPLLAWRRQQDRINIAHFMQIKSIWGSILETPFSPSVEIWLSSHLVDYSIVSSSVYQCINSVLELGDHVSIRQKLKYFLHNGDTRCNSAPQLAPCRRRFDAMSRSLVAGCGLLMETASTGGGLPIEEVEADKRV
eukprot:1339576-Amphidinium_carterae.1